MLPQDRDERLGVVANWVGTHNRRAFAINHGPIPPDLTLYAT
jgi:hypothetical protein